MRVAVLFSGGKDSVMAAFWAMMHGFDVTLVTVRPPDYSMMFHHPNIRWTKMQAEAMGLKQLFVSVTEKNWDARLTKAFRRMKAGGIATGAVESEYQRRRIDAIGEKLHIPTYAPLWHKGQGSGLMEELLGNFEIYVTAVSAEGLGPEFLGEPFRKLADAMASGKKPGIHPFLEGGEGETFVADAPFFKKRIRIKKWKKSWDGVRGVAEIESACFETRKRA
ncbi:MAG: diphthine--ammonia ligase [Candidatus ainarchaeum sp.]|nr:diphthine--ammonia ligase [Candidatus ainarchaeum sp.]